jgi:hypothetical protein
VARHRRVREMGRERTEIFHAGTWTAGAVIRRPDIKEEKTVIEDSPISLPHAIIMMS